MAGGIWIPPYKPLGVRTQAVPGGGYLDIDASAGRFEPSPLARFGLQAAEGAVGIAGVVAEQLAGDNEAVVKAADVRLGEAEQALLFDPENGFLNTQGQAALTKGPETLDAYREMLDRELAETTDDDQHDMLRGLNERRLASFTTVVERHSEVERQRWYDEAGERRIAQMQADAKLYWSDDALLRRALGTTRFEVREQAERNGWDAALTEAALRQHTSRTLASAIEGAVERDPERAQALRTRYDQHIEAADRAALDALLSEAQTRRRTEAASAAILNSTPPDGEQPTPQWRLRQAEAIAEPAVRAATIRRVLSAAATTEDRARALAEQVLTRVLKDGLTDPSQVPVREWVALDAERRQAIETRLDHNAAGTEPARNPDLVDELATQMTETPHAFARHDLVPAVAQLPMPQWQRFRDWQAGLWRNDPATEETAYAIKRGLQLASRMLPDGEPAGDNDNGNSGPSASAPFGAALVEEIDTARKLTGKSPDDAALREMVRRNLPEVSFHTIGMPPMDPKLARRLGALPGQIIEDLLFALFLMMFLNSIIPQPQTGKKARPVPSQPSDESDNEPSEPSSDPAKPPSTKPSSTPPPPSPHVPPPVAPPSTSSSAGGPQRAPVQGNPAPAPPPATRHPLEQILRPNGADIGVAGSQPIIRVVSKKELAELERQLLAAGATRGPVDPRYGGYWYTFPQGGRFGIRMSGKSGRTIDVDYPPHFPPGYKVHHVR